MAVALTRFSSIITATTKSSPSLACMCSKARHPATPPIRFNSNRTIIAKTNRKVYCRQYPTIMVNPDGSTFRVEYKEPRTIIKLPLDVNSLTAEERKFRLSRYQVRRKQVIRDDIDDDADVSVKYKHLWNKN